MEELSLWQSAQWQMKRVRIEGPEVGNASCTVPQRHVDVASFSLDQPSWASPAKGKKLSLDLVSATMVAFVKVLDGWFFLLELTLSLGLGRNSKDETG